MTQKLRQDFEIGSKIREMRKARGLTQEQVAARLQLYGIPVSRSIYSRMETGDYNIRIRELVALKVIFHVGYDAFFDGLEEKLNGE